MLSGLLSVEDNNKLNSWIRLKDKPLFITGYDGCGKTYWANELLKSYHIILLGCDFIKYSKDITEYLQSAILKKDIFMMISESNQYKALLVDDIQLFSQHDKQNLSKIYKYVTTINYSLNPVIYVCNDTLDKTIKSMKQKSYVIDIQFNLAHYRKIFRTKFNSTKQLQSLLKQTKNLNTILVNAHKFNTIQNDKVSPLNKTLHDILTIDHSCSDLLRACSSEYSILSLNLIENIPNIATTIQPKYLYEIYKSICNDDHIEYKYLQHNLDLQLRVFFSVVTPLHYVKQVPLRVNHLRYNTYISRSMIQIHNQSILQNNTMTYLRLLKDMYVYISSYQSQIKLEDMKLYIDLNLINIKTLEKQMKVFNYYYNKTMTKKQFTKVIKQVSN